MSCCASFFNHLYHGYFLQFDTPLPIWLLHFQQKLPSTHDSLILLVFLPFPWNIILDTRKLWIWLKISGGRTRKKEYFVAIIIYCLTTHATIFIIFLFSHFCFFSAKSKTQEFYLYINGQIYTAHTQKIRIHFSFFRSMFPFTVYFKKLPG